MKTAALEDILDVGIAFSKEKDRESLLDKILTTVIVTLDPYLSLNNVMETFGVAVKVLLEEILRLYNFLGKSLVGL